MFGAAWMGFGAGCLPPARGRAEIGLLAGYAGVAGILYGTLLNLWFWPFGADTATSFAFVPGAGVLHNLHSFLFFDLTTSLGFDIPRAITNAVLVLFLGRPVLAALRRASRRAAFGAPVVHEPSAVSVVGTGAGWARPGRSTGPPQGDLHSLCTPAPSTGVDGGEEEATVSLTYEEALAQVTGPGQLFEVVPVRPADGRPGVQNAPANLGQLFAGARGDEWEFLVYEDERWTFAETMRNVDALAHALVDGTGSRKGDRVGIAMRNLPEWIVSFAAILSVGAISVSLNAWWTEAELDYAIEDSGLSLLIADPERIERAHAPAHSGVPMIMVRGDQLEPNPDRCPALRRGRHPRRSDARRRGRPGRRRHHPLHVGDDRIPEGGGIDPPGRDQRADGVLVQHDHPDRPQG